MDFRKGFELLRLVQMAEHTHRINGAERAAGKREPAIGSSETVLAGQMLPAPCDRRSIDVRTGDLELRPEPLKRRSHPATAASEVEGTRDRGLCSDRFEGGDDLVRGFFPGRNEPSPAARASNIPSQARGRQPPSPERSFCKIGGEIRQPDQHLFHGSSHSLLDRRLRQDVRELPHEIFKAQF